MDKAGSELGRILTFVNRKFPGSMEWSPDRLYIRTSQMGIDEHGDTALHRMLALHAATPKSLQTFLDHLWTHHHHEMPLSEFESEQELSSSFYKNLPSPPQLDQANDRGATALHVAVHRNSLHAQDVVKMLLETQRSWSGNRPSLASIPMKCGAYPLHVLCGHNVTIREEVLTTLLEADPTVVLKDDKNGDNPLSLLWKNVLRFSWAASMEQGQVKQNVEGDPSWMAVIRQEQYVECSLQLVAAVKALKGDDSSRRVTLHDICSMPRCPPLLVRCALEQNSNNAQINLATVDDKGMLPIHHAARSPPAKRKFISARVSEKLLSVVELLVEAHPQGAMVVDNYGRLPLHYALENGHLSEKTIWALVNAYPGSLRVQDPITGLYPFMLAEAYGILEDTLPEGFQNKPNNDQVNMTYLLLRFCPEVIGYDGKAH